MSTSRKKLLVGEGDPDETMSSDSEEEKFAWTPKSIEIMLNEYKNNMDKLLRPGVPRRRIWDVVRKKLAQEGFQGVRSDMCLKKFGKLKLLYENFNSGQKVHRSFVNHAKIIKEILDKSPVELKSDDDDRNEDMKDCPAWFACFMEKYLKDEDERRSMFRKFHEEIVAVESKKCLLLETLIARVTSEPSPSSVVTAHASSDQAIRTVTASPSPMVKPVPCSSNGEVAVKTEGVKRKLSPDVKLHKVIKKPPSSDHCYNNTVSHQQPPSQPATPKPQQPSLKGLSALFKNNFNHNIQVIPVEGDQSNGSMAVHENVITIHEEVPRIDAEEGVVNLPSDIIILNEEQPPTEDAPQEDSNVCE